jgi:hypothetical protein
MRAVNIIKYVHIPSFGLVFAVKIIIVAAIRNQESPLAGIYFAITR